MGESPFDPLEHTPTPEEEAARAARQQGTGDAAKSAEELAKE